MRQFWILFGLIPGCVNPVPASPEQPVFLGGLRPQGALRRVVSLAPSVTEMLFALGVGDRVVGVTRFDDHPPEVKNLPKVGGFVDPSIEVIVGLKPDLVLCVPNSGNPRNIRTLVRLRVPVLLIPTYRLDDVYTAIEALGRLFDRAEQAATIVSDMRRRASAVSSRVAGRPAPEVLIVYGHRPIVAAGPGTFADELVRLAGGRNVLAGSKVRYPNVPMEMIVKSSLEVIVDASYSGHGGVMDPDELLGHWGRWKVIPAVRHGRVYLFDSVLFFRPGPRLIEGLERLERLIHHAGAAEASGGVRQSTGRAPSL